MILQAFTGNPQDQITEVESRELDAEEQQNVRRSARSRKGRKQDTLDCFPDDDYDDQLTRNTRQSWHIYYTSKRLFRTINESVTF